MFALFAKNSKMEHGSTLILTDFFLIFGIISEMLPKTDNNGFKKGTDFGFFIRLFRQSVVVLSSHRWVRDGEDLAILPEHR